MPEWLITLLVAVLGLGVGIIGARYGRVGRLERQVATMTTQERLLWLYTRSLIDHIYRGQPPPPPPPPAGFLEGRADDD